MFSIWLPYWVLLSVYKHLQIFAIWKISKKFIYISFLWSLYHLPNKTAQKHSLHTHQKKKRTDYWHIQQHERISKWCWVQKARHKRLCTIWLHLQEILGKTNLISNEGKQTGSCLGQQVRGWIERNHKRTLWNNENILYLYCGVYKFIKTHRNAHLKLVHITACHLYFNEADFEILLTY